MRRAFDAIVGNSSLKQRLLSDVFSDTLSHAYIIEGKKGSGKHTIAIMIAAALACENKHNESSALPCCECPSCKKILNGYSPDIIFINKEDKASVLIDKIRFLRTDARILPNELDYKIYIVEDAHTMTTEAQNALLLTLEEPPSYVKIFLLSEDADRFLETIRSRAPILRTEPIPDDKIDEYLQTQNDAAKRLKLTDPNAYSELIVTSNGCIGKALDLLDPKTLAAISESRALAIEFLEAVAERKNMNAVNSLISRFAKKRDGFIDQLETIETALRDLLVLCRTENAPLLFFYDRDAALSLVDRTHIHKLMKVYDAISNAKAALSINANLKLTVINLFSEINII